MADTVLALTTLPADFNARDMARELVSRRVAACVTLLPSVASTYTWQGVIEEDTEQQVVIKTTRDRIDALWRELKALHPYDVPEFLVVPVVDGNPQYLRWVEDSVRSG